MALLIPNLHLSSTPQKLRKVNTSMLCIRALSFEINSTRISLSASKPCLHPEGQWPKAYHPQYNANKCWYSCPRTVYTSDYTLVLALISLR